MKSFKDMLETVDKIKSPDEQNFANKHIVDKMDHPVAKDDQFVAKTQKKKRVADHEDDKAVYEEERMIVCPDCEESYPKGDEHECDMEESTKTESVKSRVVESFLAKFAIQETTEVELEETFSKGKLELRDRTKVTLTSKDAMALNALFGQLNDRNQEKMDQRMMKNKKGFDEIMGFAREAM